MNDTANGPAGAGTPRSDLEPRLSEIERHLRRLEEGLAPPGTRRTELEVEFRVLREAVADLSASNLDLHNQLITLMSSCERILAGASGDILVSGRRGAFKTSVSFVQRVARRTVKGTIGAARRLAGIRPNGPVAVLDLEIVLGNSPVIQAPRIAVVVRTSEDPSTIELPANLRRQTEPDLVVAVWNEGMSKATVHESDAKPAVVSAVDRSAVAAAVSAGLVADVSLPIPRLHPTLLERCRWTVASEDVPLLLAELAVGSSSGWRLEPVVDWVARGAPGNGRAQSTLVKMVGGGWGAFARPGTLVVGAGLGRSYEAPAGATGLLVHRVAPLTGLVAAHPAGDERPAALVITSRHGGELTAWLLRSMEDDLRCTVVLTGEADGSPVVRALTELADRVYPIGGFLEPEVWPSLVADLARAHQVQTLIRVGAEVDLPDFNEPRPLVVDLPLHRSEIAAEADLVLALGRDIGNAASERGLETIGVVPGPMAAGGIPAAEELAGIRAAYGVPDEARLVLAVCNLEPANRPEDVAAVALRLRHLEDAHVLLVGQGSLAGSISDIAGYFELDRFSLAPPGHSLSGLVAVSDCVLSTAEIDPWPVVVGVALALGRSVVATEIDGVRELAAAADFDRCVLCPPGDVEALAAAVVEALETHRRPRATKKAWNAAATRAASAAEALREALGRVPAGESETR